MACIYVSSAQMSCLQTVTRCYIISLHVRGNDFNHTFQSKSFVSARQKFLGRYFTLISSLCMYFRYFN